MTSPTRSPPSRAGHPQVRAILGAVGATFVWALFDRAPLERWSVGRVTLAACLAEAGSDIPGALDRYQRLRIPRTSRLQAM